MGMFLDRRSSVLNQYESFRRKGSRDDSLGRYGSLERQKSNSLDKRQSWLVEDCNASLENIKPITLTVNSFFKQVEF